MTKYIIVTGGVLSSLGKGIASSSIGFLLERCGYKVKLLKFDPYINVDPGTMNPYQHGEVYVTEDGAETDLDLGHYERFTHYMTSKESNYTSGQIYESVINKERRGDYLGKTVQVIPHITDEIKGCIKKISKDADIVITEIGGTVGDIESQPFLEAVRQLRLEVGKNNAIFVHLTLVPYISAAGELKTKPTQHSVKELRAIGIQPDIILCRTDRFLPQSIKAKISLFCNVDQEAVITAKDVKSIYEVPLVFHKEGLDKKILELLSLPIVDIDLSDWELLVKKIYEPMDLVRIGVVGKYVEHDDAYKSLKEALIHGAIYNNLGADTLWLEAEQFEDGNNLSILDECDGILVPGGFGKRGIEGMIVAINYARINKKPFFGICLGMQCAVIEFARNVCNLDGANSSEFDPQAKHKLFILLKDLIGVDKLGGTMRLGAYPCILSKDSFAYEAYKQEIVSDRHRHRYEFNIEYKEILEKYGMRFTGISPDKRFVEIIELPNSPWFLGCQFHPEYKSKPTSPHPLFVDFIKASYKCRKEKKQFSYKEKEASK
jgi:CTP synthase